MSRNIVAWFPHIAVVSAAIYMTILTTAPVQARPIHVHLGPVDFWGRGQYGEVAVMEDIWSIEDDLRELDQAVRAADAGQ
jgi:hypothetical protein